MRHRFPALLLVAVLATLAPLLILDTHAPDDRPDAAEQAGSGTDVPGTQRLPGVRRRAADSDPSTWQTSDRVVGPSAPQVSPRLASRRTTKLRFRYRIAPGVFASSYQEKSPRGKVRYFVITAKWTRAGVGVAYAHPSTVAQTRKTRFLTRRVPKSVAGVNGDFFDIGDTGAPLGLGVAGSSLISGRKSGWNAAFYLDSDGVPRIDTVPITTTVRNRPKIEITNVNSPQVMPFGTGVYTPAWGKTSGYRWTDGQRKNVLMLRVENGIVVEKRKVIKAGHAFQGRIVVSRGKAQTERLSRVDVGDAFRVGWGVQGAPRLAITGNQIVLRRYQVVATDDVELHPRTAVGIDRKRKRLILLVVEGRQRFSDGYTMVQVGKLLKRLGAQAGLNLDGGGSTTMVARREGDLRVINSPSDGAQRRVANGLVVTYRKPKK